MNKTYTFIIGSGFSAPVGLPIGQSLNKKLLEVENLPIGFSTSGELMVSKDGTRPDIGFKTSYDDTFFFGVKLMKHYYKKFDTFDYEDFYDYFNKIHERAIKKKRDVDLQELYELLPINYYTQNENEDKRGLQLYHQTYQLNHIYQELVNYLLTLPDEIDVSLYEKFVAYLIKLVNEGNVVNIYSLNHDVLIENIIHNFHQDNLFCDGFTNINTPYYGLINGEYSQLEYFANQYDKPIRFHKLHGSTSYYAFYKEVETASFDASNMIKRPYGLNDFDLYYTDGNDIILRKKVRGMLSMGADFLTGTTAKIRRYESPIYYKPQFENFEKDLTVTNSLIIIGYGFKDARINEIVRQKLNASAQCAVIDPFMSVNSKSTAEKILPNLHIVTKKIEEMEWV